MLAKITKTAVEKLQPGEWLWDSLVKGFGARRQRDGAFYYLRIYRLERPPVHKIDWPSWIAVDAPYSTKQRRRRS